MVKEVTWLIQKVKYLSHFIHLASELLHPLQQSAKTTKFFWSPTLNQYFASTKEVLASLSIIMSPCFEYSFNVNPSIGSKTIGVVLLQQDPHSLCMRPIYFASRVLLDVEKGYSDVEQAMLFLMFAVQKF